MAIGRTLARVLRLLLLVIVLLAGLQYLLGAIWSTEPLPLSLASDKIYNRKVNSSLKEKNPEMRKYQANFSLPHNEAGAENASQFCHNTSCQNETIGSKFYGSNSKAMECITGHRLPEYLIKAEYISVDPYLRAYAHQLTPPYDQFSFQVGTVTESKNSDFPVGTKVVSHLGWRDYTIVDPNAKYEFCEPFKLTDLTGTNLKPSVGVGLMGMPGATAYLAFLEVCQPKEGDTVVITGAAGAVGLLVGQIAKIKGCKIIGFAGSDDKVKWLTKEGGFDFAFNYKTADVVASLKKAAPNGVNSYFDNVGGEISSQIMSQLAPNGKVVVVGCISTYNHENLSVQKASVVQPSILFNRLTVKGFIIWDHPLSEWNVAFEDYKKWVKEGRLLVKEHVTEGFDNLVKALLGMLRGENYGKAVVKV